MRSCWDTVESPATAAAPHRPRRGNCEPRVPAPPAPFPSSEPEFPAHLPLRPCSLSTASLPLCQGSKSSSYPAAGLETTSCSLSRGECIFCNYPSTYAGSCTIATASERRNTHYILALQRLCVSYRPNRRAQPRHAVRELSVPVAQGELVGFPGPHDAGKSSTINTLMGFARPVRGRPTC